MKALAQASMDVRVIMSDEGLIKRCLSATSGFYNQDEGVGQESLSMPF